MLERAEESCADLRMARHVRRTISCEVLAGAIFSVIHARA